jgi:hypothetical protein
MLDHEKEWLPPLGVTLFNPFPAEACSGRIRLPLVSC